jgi:hypothetical protein
VARLSGPELIERFELVLRLIGSASVSKCSGACLAVIACLLGESLGQPIGDGQARSATTGDDEIILGSKLRDLAPDRSMGSTARKPNNRRDDGE